MYQTIPLAADKELLISPPFLEPDLFSNLLTTIFPIEFLPYSSQP